MPSRSSRAWLRARPVRRPATPDKDALAQHGLRQPPRRAPRRKTELSARAGARRSSIEGGEFVGPPWLPLSIARRCGFRCIGGLARSVGDARAPSPRPRGLERLRAHGVSGPARGQAARHGVELFAHGSPRLRSPVHRSRSPGREADDRRSRSDAVCRAGGLPPSCASGCARTGERRRARTMLLGAQGGGSMALRTLRRIDLDSRR